jgi:zinc protease
MIELSSQSQEYHFMRGPLLLTLIVLSPVLLPLPTRAQEPGALPKAETVLDQFVEATGGKAAYEKFKNRTRSGTIEVPAANATGKIQIFQAAPKKLAIVTEIGPAKSTQATDGTTVWQTSPDGARLMDAAEKDDFLRDATFNAEIHSKDLYEKLECVGVEDVEGKPAYKVVLTAKTGKTETEYYDKASHLLVKETTTTKGPMGDVSLESILSDYKKVDGLLMPFTITQKIEGQQFVIKFTEVKHDADIPADTFRKPASLDDAEKKKAD